MVFSSWKSQTFQKEEVKQLGDGETDSCPLLGEAEIPSNGARSHQIRDVRRFNNDRLSPKCSLAQRIRSRKNRLVQRVLVTCRLADRPRDLTFKQEQRSNNIAIERLATIRSSLFTHSQSIIGVSTAICCFTGNSSCRLCNDSQEIVAHITVEGCKIHECSLVFRDQVNECVLAKIDQRLTELKHIRLLFDKRANLVLDVEYAKRTLTVEQQKGNVNHIAERKQALQHAEIECKRATRIIADQLKIMRVNQDTDVYELLQEYAQLVVKYFERTVDLVSTAK